VLQPNAKAYQVKQVHGAVVLRTGETRKPKIELGDDRDRVSAQELSSGEQNLCEADGLVTEQVNEAVWVCSADCTPVLIADGRTGQVAAVHAGWRGTAAKIVPEAIGCLQSQGSRLQDLRLALGPAIDGEVYQVALEVAAEVGATLLQADSGAALMAALQQLSPAPVLPDAEPGRVRLDVRQVIRWQLEHLGIAAEQIAIAPHCTYQDADYFFSYRRDRQKKVQWSGIVSGS